MQALARDLTIEEPVLGTVLDGRFQLITKLIGAADRPRFVAIDLQAGEEVELVLKGRQRGRHRYSVRPRRGDRQAATSSPSRDERYGFNARALDTFASRIALTGVATHSPGKSVYSGYDRRTLRPVRIVVEEL